jgi:hypothetical protein
MNSYELLCLACPSGGYPRDTGDFCRIGGGGAVTGGGAPELCWIFLLLLGGGTISSSAAQIYSPSPCFFLMVAPVLGVPVWWLSKGRQGFWSSWADV